MGHGLPVLCVGGGILLMVRFRNPGYLLSIKMNKRIVLMGTNESSRVPNCKCIKCGTVHEVTPQDIQKSDTMYLCPKCGMFNAINNGSPKDEEPSGEFLRPLLRLLAREVFNDEINKIKNQSRSL